MQFARDIQALTARDRMTSAERGALRARIAAYVEFYPHASRTTNVSWLRQSLDMMLRTHTLLSGGVVAALMLIVSLPFFAERAQPGEALYAVKTGITEPIRASLISSPAEKVSYETELLERRIVEVQLLAETGKLDSVTEQKLAASIEKHTQEAQKGIAALETSDTAGAEVARLALTSTLTAGDVIISNNDTPAPVAVKDVMSKALQGAEQNGAHATTSPATEDRVRAHMEEQYNRARELRADIDTTLSDSERTSIDGTLKSIDARIAALPQSSTATTTPGADGARKIVADLKKLTMLMADIRLRDSIDLSALLATSTDPLLNDEHPIATSTDKEKPATTTPAVLGTSTELAQ